MSRISRYKDSLNRFIKEKSCLYNTDVVMDANTKSLLYNKIMDSNKILAILLLTIMNSQNKKKKISMQGYYAATAIEFLNLIIILVDDKETIIKNKNHDYYNKLIINLINSVNKSLCQNIESISNHISLDISYKMMIEIMNLSLEKLTHNYLLNDHVFELENTTPDKKILKSYFKDDKKIVDIFNKLKKIKKKSFMEYIEKKYHSISEITIIAGWLIGCGNEKNINFLKNISKHFSIIYKISIDFENIYHDLTNSHNNISKNFILNYGFQDAHELFMENKNKFIEKAMTLDIYTGTVQEIIHCLENKVDLVISDTSPDMRSNFSNITK